MKDDSRIITIDGKKYAVDCTFDRSPAIYYTTAIISAVHIDESHLSASKWRASVPAGSVIIVATPVEEQDAQRETVIYLSDTEENEHDSQGSKSSNS